MARLPTLTAHPPTAIVPIWRIGDDTGSCGAHARRARHSDARAPRQTCCTPIATNLASALAAADAWAAELAERPSDFDAAWKLARADYWLGGHAPTAQRRTFLARGIEAGRRAIAAAPIGRKDTSGPPPIWVRWRRRPVFAAG